VIFATIADWADSGEYPVTCEQGSDFPRHRRPEFLRNRPPARPSARLHQQGLQRRPKFDLLQDRRVRRPLRLNTRGAHGRGPCQQAPHPWRLEAAHDRRQGSNPRWRPSRHARNRARSVCYGREGCCRHGPRNGRDCSERWKDALPLHRRIGPEGNSGQWSAAPLAQERQSKGCTVWERTVPV
jgi:hypothetical protein